MKKYAITDTNGNATPEEFTTIEEATKRLQEYEEEDRKDGAYEEGYWEVCLIDNTSEPTQYLKVEL